MRHRTHPLASKWTTLIAGLCFAVAGLLGVVTSIPQFDKFAIRQWIEPRPNSPSVTFSGFDPGYTALFCMAVFSLGTGIAASRLNGFAIEGWIVGILAGGFASGIGFLIGGWRHMPPHRGHEITDGDRRTGCCS